MELLNKAPGNEDRPEGDPDCMMSELKGVAETLYIPLTARIQVSKRFPGFFYDEEALKLEKELPNDRVEKNSGEYFYMASVCRYKVMDEGSRKGYILHYGLQASQL